VGDEGTGDAAADHDQVELIGVEGCQIAAHQEVAAGSGPRTCR
jgi:hypothetical protein